jgi:hypothetical protein
MVRGAIDKGSNRFFPIPEERSHEEGNRFSMQEWMDRSLFLHEDKGKPLRSRDFLAGDRHHRCSPQHVNFEGNPSIVLVRLSHQQMLFCAPDAMCKSAVASSL